MAARHKNNKALIHLLEQEQEPFHLQTYIADMRSQFNKSSPAPATASASALQLRKRKPLAQETAPKSGGFCFYSLRRSPEASTSPITDFQSPGMSPCNMSPVSPVFLRVPPSTAALLVEAAMRIQKRRRSQVRILGLGMFGALLKRLKDRNNNHRKRAIADKEITIQRNCEDAELGDRINFNSREIGNCRSHQSKEMKISDRCSLREALLSSTSVSPIRFSLHRSPSSSGCHTPEFSSPASRHSQQGKANSQTRNPENAEGEEDEGQKEHCSPVSVLDSFLEEDEQRSIEPEGDDSDHDSSYANVLRVKEQLLSRLRRFEKLAELDPIEFEKRLLESNSDDECQLDSLASSTKGEPFSPCRDEDIELDVFNLSSLLQHNSSDTKTLLSGNSDVWGRICKKLESWKEVEFIDTLVELQDLKNEFGGWQKFSDEVEEVAKEVEAAIMGVLVDELLQQQEEGSSTECI